MKVTTSSSIKPTEAFFGAKVTRCRCGDPWKIHACHCSLYNADPKEHLGQPCPYGNDPCPIGVQDDLGIVSYWHKNPLKRFVYWFRTRILNERVNDEESL